MKMRLTAGMPINCQPSAFYDLSKTKKKRASHSISSLYRSVNLLKNPLAVLKLQTYLGNLTNLTQNTSLSQATNAEIFLFLLCRTENSSRH